MKKKLLITLMAITAVLCCAFGFAACGGAGNGGDGGNGGNGGNTEQGGNTQKPEHTTHVYDQKNTDAKYLKSKANCQHKAVYYFSCSCGKQGEETFEYGEPGKHEFKTYVSDDNATCTKNGTETAKCENCNEKDTRDIPDSKLKHDFINYVFNNDATCIKNGTETAKCEHCDEEDTREKENSKLSHTYDKKVAEPEYLKLKATCQNKAEYYYSCACGKQGEETFEYGESGNHEYINYVSNNDATCLKNGTETAKCEHCSATETREKENSKLSHTYDKKVVQPEYLKTDATCQNKAEYYYSCVCGKQGEETFEYGELAAHSYKDGKCETCGAKQPTAGLEYELNEDKISYCVKGKGKATDTDIVIPEKYLGLPVTGIGERAFEYCTSLTSVVIPDSVTTVGGGVFCECRNLKSVTLSKNIKSLPTYKVGMKIYGFFEWCIYLTDVTLPDGLKSIGDYGFKSCYNLTDLTIPDSVTSIGDYAFSDCDSLTQVENGVKYVGKWAVGCDKYITEATVKDGTVGISDSAFCVSASKLRVITIPDGVKYIGDMAFMDCGSLEKIEIPGSVISIGGSAFFNCKNMQSVTICSGIKTIKGGAFTNCYSLTEIKFEDVAGYCQIEGLGQLEKSKIYIGDQKLTETASIVVPDGVKIISDNAFKDCASLTEVSISDSVTDICDYAFYGCALLNKLTIPDGVTTIGWYAFYGCSSLASITIPDGVNKIGSAAFEDCASLTELTIVAEVADIDDSAFSGCPIETATISASACSRINNKNLKTVTVTCGESIDWQALRGCSSLTSVTIADSVTSIGEDAFDSCPIETATVPAIACNFIANSKLKSVTVTSGESLGEYAFGGCNSLTSVSLPQGLKSIGKQAFSGCTALEGLTIPDSVTEIGEGAFDGCAALKSITLPDGVTSIGRSAFSGCSVLESIVIPDDVTKIDRFVFENCTALKSIVIPVSVTEIEGYVFYNCSALTSITFKGTKEQWYAIKKGSSWNGRVGNYTVHCTDGDVDGIGY